MSSESAKKENQPSSTSAKRAVSNTMFAFLWKPKVRGPRRANAITAGRNIIYFTFRRRRWITCLRLRVEKRRLLIWREEDETREWPLTSYLSGLANWPRLKSLCERVEQAEVRKVIRRRFLNLETAQTSAKAILKRKSASRRWPGDVVSDQTTKCEDTS